MEKGGWSGGALTPEAGKDEMKVQRPEKTESEDMQGAQEGVVGVPLGGQGPASGALQAKGDEVVQSSDTAMVDGQSQGLVSSEGGEASQTLAQESSPMSQAQLAGNVGVQVSAGQVPGTGEIQVTGEQVADSQAVTGQDGVGAQSAGVIASNMTSGAGGMPSMRSGRAANPFANQPGMISEGSPRGDIILQPSREKKSLKLSLPLIFGMVGVGVVLVILALVFSLGGKPKVDAVTAFNDFKNYLENGPAEDEVLIAPPEETTEDGVETESEGESQVVGETVGQLEDLDRSDGKWFFEAIGESDASEDFVNKYYENLEAKYKVFLEAVEAGNYQVEDKDGFLEGVRDGAETLNALSLYRKKEELVVDAFKASGEGQLEEFLDGLGQGAQNEYVLSVLDDLRGYIREQVELLNLYESVGCPVDEEGEVDGACVEDQVEQGNGERIIELTEGTENEEEDGDVLAAEVIWYTESDLEFELISIVRAIDIYINNINPDTLDESEDDEYVTIMEGSETGGGDE